MADAETTELSNEEVVKVTRENLIGFAFGTITYLKVNNQSIDDWATFLGRLFAPGWQIIEGSVLAIAREAALCFVSLGGDLEELRGDDSHAEAILSMAGVQQILQNFGLDNEDIEALWKILAIIAQSFGLRHNLQREGDRIKFVFARDNV